MTVPKTQYAVQLVGPDELKLNTAKEVFTPGPHQILAKIEAVGLCFSDLKLLKQFSGHARKGEILEGLSREVLGQIASYVPGERPTVPGHEVTCRIVATGEGVTRHKVGERVMVQTDYRQLPTNGSNAAFGYNFEGALQEYVLMDERVVVAPDGERFLIPVDEALSASASCLVEPWACVEDAYVNIERQTIKAGGRLLIVAEADRQIDGVYDAFAPEGPPAEIVYLCADETQRLEIDSLEPNTIEARELSDLEDESFDDIIYFGHQAQVIEALNDKLAARGIMNLVLGGERIGRPVSVGVGRIHYGRTRWVGTTGTAASQSYGVIPASGEVRDGDRVLVIGAGGPMGQMHVIRDLCSGRQSLMVVATDIDDARLEGLTRKAQPLAQAGGHAYKTINTKKEPIQEKFTYITLMAPVGALVADAIGQAEVGCLINVFAGIPAPTRHELDLDTYIEKRCFLFGTSGSTIQDMKIVLGKVTAGQLDTDTSVDAISGMAGAVDGIRAVEQRTLAGKIVVYPPLHEMGLIPLAELGKHYPTVAAKLDGGKWCKAAEEELLRVAGAANG